jgi:hypothetical protein
MNKYQQKNKPSREQDKCIMAVHRETGKFFGGKGSGTHVGYSRIGHLKSAMTNADRKHDDYYFVSLSFDKYGLPEITLLEGSPNTLLDLNPEAECLLCDGTGRVSKDCEATPTGHKLSYKDCDLCDGTGKVKGK